jgi:hypothetical protein
MSAVQIAMIAGLPYTALRDAVLTHPTLVEGLIPLFSSVASAHNGALATPCRSSGGAIVSVRTGSSGDDAVLAPAFPTVSHAEARSNVRRDPS